MNIVYSGYPSIRKPKLERTKLGGSEKWSLLIMFSEGDAPTCVFNPNLQLTAEPGFNYLATLH